MAFPNDVLATKATCSSPVGLPDSIYSREHKKIALLVPETPTGPSASHFSLSEREGLAWGRLCFSEEEQDFFGVLRDAVGDPTHCSEDTAWLTFPCHVSFLLYKPIPDRMVRKPQIQRLL